MKLKTKLIPIKIILFNEQFNFIFTESNNFLLCLPYIFENKDIIIK